MGGGYLYFCSFYGSGFGLLGLSPDTRDRLTDGVAFKTTKEKVKYLALKAKVTREQTSDDSDSQGRSDEDVDEEEAKAFNLMARNFQKFFRKGHFASECRKPKENKAFVGGAWSDSEDDDVPQNDATCLMAIDSQELLRFNKDLLKHLKEKHSLESEKSKLVSKINDLEIEVKKLVNNKEVVEPCRKCKVLTKEVDSLKYNASKLQDEALNFSKFKKSSVVLDDMLSRQKLSQDKEGLGISKNDKTTSASLNKQTVFVKES
nr:hypothetical protein [Tanacetum cinerariifolium]